MSAAHLLATISERGATARAEIGDDGAAVLVVAPRSAIGDLLPGLARFKPALLALLAPDDAAPVAHRWQAATGDASATDAALPDVSAIAPDVLPQLAPDECAALLARYRAGGAILTLEMVEHDGAQSLALGIELTARVAPEKRARAFTKITAHGLEVVRALELEGAPITDGGAAAMLYAPNDLALEAPQLT